MVFDQSENLRPLFSEVISDEKEGADPDGGAAVCIHCEVMKLEFRRSGDDRGEMAYSWNVVANHERPMADAIEPIVNAADMLIFDVQKAADGRMEKLPADGSADDVAERDSDDAAR